ncbi:MAG: conjugal transfer protein, partial [Porcipelethomonas sp.]
KFFGVSSKASDEPVVTVSKPTESKSPEKKEDVWTNIRGMKKADEIITALEAVGITSFTEFSGFMWNTRHDDDHTEELSILKKKINAVDSLIAKMKHRDELAPVYKEYKGKSGWAQSRFKNKNADKIEDYEQTAAYIKEHSKPFYVDDKPPKRSDLQERSTELKDDYNALAKEHKDFLAKKATAQQYTRTVRSYLNNKHNHEAAEQSRQRKHTQQRPNDTLE